VVASELPWTQRTASAGLHAARAIAAAVALVGKPKPERPHGLPGQFDMFGAPEVPPSVPAACAVDSRAVVELVADLEQVLAFLRDEGHRATISKAIAFLLRHLASRRTTAQ
jgi:hypothetical protein